MFYGYDQGVMSQVNLNPHYQELMGIAPIEGIVYSSLYQSPPECNLCIGNQRNVAALGGIVAVYYGGTLIGALVAGSLADRCGRIKAVVFGSLWALLGAVLQASAYNITWMCCARVIAGVGVGAIDCVIPVWSAEVSSHSARGAFLAIEFFMVSTGILDSSAMVNSYNGNPDTDFYLNRTLEVSRLHIGSSFSPILILIMKWHGGRRSLYRSSLS